MPCLDPCNIALHFMYMGKFMMTDTVNDEQNLTNPSSVKEKKTNCILAVKALISFSYRVEAAADFSLSDWCLDCFPSMYVSQAKYRVNDHSSNYRKQMHYNNIPMQFNVILHGYVVVVLLLNVHGQQLRSCWDGQLT